MIDFIQIIYINVDYYKLYISFILILFIVYYGVGGFFIVSDGVLILLVDRVYRWGMEELGYQVVDCNGEL